MSTITAAGHTWHHVQRGTGPGCWHQDSEGGRCLSLQGVLDEHTSWVWLQARDQIARDLLEERRKVADAEGATARDEAVITGVCNGLIAAARIAGGES